MQKSKINHHEHILDAKLLSVLNNPFNIDFKGVVIHDGICGVGKTTSIRNHIENLLEISLNRVIYVAPFIDELHRMAGTEAMSVNNDNPRKIIKNGKEIYFYKNNALKGKFKHPATKRGYTKSASLKELINKKENIVMTHQLFKLIDEDTIKLLNIHNYHLIIDEEIQVIDTIKDRYNLKINNKQLAKMFTLNNREINELINLKIINVDYKNNQVSWCDSYLNRYNDIRHDIINNHIDFYPKDVSKPPTLIWRLNPEIFKSFKSVHILTYLFKESILQGYFNANKIPYFIEDMTDESIFLSEKDVSGNVKRIINPVHKLITYHKANKFEIPVVLNEEGGPTRELSSHYFDLFLSDKFLSNDSILKKKLVTFFKSNHPITNNPPILAEKMWTTFKKAKSVLSDDGYRNAFIPFNSKATNKYRQASHLAYFCNAYCPVEYKSYLGALKSSFNESQWSTSSLVQWIFRSSIRDGNHIKLFLPSNRMRILLDKWLEKFENAYEDRMSVVDNYPNVDQDIVSNTPNITIDDYIKTQPGIKYMKDYSKLLSSF